MTDADCTKPLFEASVKLCAAVKKHICLHDQASYTKNAHPNCEAAWQIVAEECSESIEFCKNRWKQLRRSFFDGLKRKGNKYYLHDHLDFLLGKKSKQSSMAMYNDDTNSNLSDSLQKNEDNKIKLKRDRAVNKIFDDDDVKSFGSQTTSADESNDNSKQTTGVFIINEFEDDETYQPEDKELEDDRRLSFNRSCKRALDPQIIDELADEESQPKRTRKSDKSHKPYTVRVDKTKLTAQKVESVKTKSMNNITSTESKGGIDIGVQCGDSGVDFDDIFMQSIKNQLQEMNGRQKMNFKRKIYQSLLEVFDDANDFPNTNETLPFPNKQPLSVVNTTVGELRLLRELVSLVQAAKNTPEIMNAKEKVKPIVETTPSKSTKSPLSISPTPDDEDLPFFIDDSDIEEEIPLPRSWEEIKAKTAETSKTTPQENNIGLPRRILQKVVRVSGSSGGTIVAHDGDKKRIYRIVPKQVQPNGNSSTQYRNESSVGRLLMSAAKTSQDLRKDNSVGTFYVSNPKTAQEISKANTSLPNITIRPFNNKNIISSHSATVSPNNSNQHTNTNTNYNNANGHTIFKNIHPANRILSSSTGYFKMVPSAKTITPPLTPKPTSQSTATVAVTNPSVSKVMTAKLPVKPMLPPNSIIATKRVQSVHGPPILQRRYSICGPSLPAEKKNTETLANTAKSVVSTTNGKPEVKSSISQIQISQPVSLNAKAINNSAASSSQTSIISSSPKLPTVSQVVKSAEPPVSKDAKLPAETSKESMVRQKLVVPAKDPVLETTVVQRQIPILETAGTVEADDLDPLFVKDPQVKSEPIDDD